MARDKVEGEDEEEVESRVGEGVISRCACVCLVVG